MIIEEDPADLAGWQEFVAGKPVESRGFCPTGPGGGIDNSCSSKQGGGGGDAKYAKGDSMKRRDVQVGQRVSITKYGQKTTRTGVVESVIHGDKESEITLRGDDGSVTTIKIRNLASITDQAGEEQAKPSEPLAPASKVRGTRPDPKEFNVDSEGRRRFRSAVTEFCKQNGVTLIGSQEGINSEGANISSLNEVAAGVETCVREGVPLPPIIKLFTPASLEDADTFGYYQPSAPNAIHVNARLDEARIAASAKSGWIASSRPGMVVVHEAAHAAHDRAMRSDPSVARGDQLGHVKRGIGGLPTNRLTGRAAEVISSHVSRYAVTEPAEFVAETYTAHVEGRPMPSRIWKLYKKYGGPTPPGGYPEGYPD